MSKVVPCALLPVQLVTLRLPPRLLPLLGQGPLTRARVVQALLRVGLSPHAEDGKGAVERLCGEALREQQRKLPVCGPDGSGQADVAVAVLDSTSDY